MNSAATAEATFEGQFPKPGDFGADPKSGVAPDSEEPESVEVKLAGEKAQRYSIALDRAENDRERIGREFGKALIELRGTVKHGQWAIKLRQLGISDEKARYWMDKVEGNPTNRHKKAEPKPEQSGAEPPKTTLPSWKVLGDELKVLADAATLLKNSEPPDAAFLDRLSRFAVEMGIKTEKEETNA